jgi:hypothetical protein
MGFRKLAYSVLGAFVIASCSSSESSLKGKISVGDFDHDGLADTVFVKNWINETDIGIKYGTGIEQKIATFPFHKEVHFANVIGDNIEVWWSDTEGDYAFKYQVTRFYNKGVSGDTAIFSTERSKRSSERFFFGT